MNTSEKRSKRFREKLCFFSLIFENVHFSMVFRWFSRQEASLEAPLEGSKVSSERSSASRDPKGLPKGFVTKASQRGLFEERPTLFAEMIWVRRTSSCAKNQLESRSIGAQNELADSEIRSLGSLIRTTTDSAAPK